MEVQFHECHRRVDSVVERIFVSVLANPREVRPVEILLEVLDAMPQYLLRIVFIESFVESNDLILLLSSEKLDRTTL